MDLLHIHKTGRLDSTTTLGAKFASALFK